MWLPDTSPEGDCLTLGSNVIAAVYLGNSDPGFPFCDMEMIYLSGVL